MPFLWCPLYLPLPHFSFGNERLWDCPIFPLLLPKSTVLLSLPDLPASEMSCSSSIGKGCFGSPPKRRMESTSARSDQRAARSARSAKRLFRRDAARRLSHGLHGLLLKFRIGPIGLKNSSEHRNNIGISAEGFSGSIVSCSGSRSSKRSSG